MRSKDTKRAGAVWFLAGAVVSGGMLFAGAAAAQFACNENVNCTVLTPGPVLPGETVRISCQFGAGLVIGGPNQMLIQTFLYALDCANDGLFPCADEGPIVSFGGNQVLSGAGACAASAANASTLGNVTTFDFVPDLVLNSNQTCNLQWDVVVNSVGVDATPNNIESAGSYDGLCSFAGGQAQGQPTLAIAVGDCGVQLDRQVSCNGLAGPFVDQGFGDAVAQECNGNLTSTVVVRHRAENTGDFDLLDCVLSDGNTNVLAAPLAVGTIMTLFEQDISGFCVDLDSLAEPATAAIACECESPSGFRIPANDADAAGFMCVSPPTTVPTLPSPWGQLLFSGLLLGAVGVYGLRRPLQLDPGC